MNNKNAIITGASRGIGRATALILAAHGYNLYICCSKSQEELFSLKEEVIALGVKCHCFVGDIGDYSNAKSFVDIVKSNRTHIDVLINNAGISYIGLLQDMTPDEWNKIVSTNLTSIFNMTHLVIPHMLSQKSGKIINISSVWGLCGSSCEVAYSATKGGINAFTKALGKELAPSNIQVNALACGAVDTQMNNCFTKDELNELCESLPTGRMATANEIGKMILSILNAPSYLTGEVIKIDGGWI